MGEDMKKIALSFDGTWNTPDNDADINAGTNTNVYKLHQLIRPTDSSGVAQVKWYDTGVGTDWYNRFRGGIFGVGLSQNILEGYAKLIELYEEGDQVFIFGFSRGAYTARSLVGLIRNAGLLKKNQAALPDLIQEAYSLYRTKDDGPDEGNAKLFRAEFSHEIDIQCLGVWDTVGSLGIPLSSFKWFNRSFYQFHDTNLSAIVKNAFQALAIDEHRKDYQATLWELDNNPPQRIEQVWFAGAHANIGGGYADSRLSDIALAWMADRAGECGLSLNKDLLPETSECPALPITDSYEAFLNGAYSLFSDRYHRPIGFTAFQNEQIDGSVGDRCKCDQHYWPKNLINEYLREVFSKRK